MSDIVIINNFFNNFENIKNEFKKITLYTQDDFNKKFNANQNWPGKRSETLCDTHPFFINYFVDTCYKNELFKNKKLEFNQCYVHLRLDKDNKGDWIHTDPWQYTMLVFLSPTCLTSGTNFYLEKQENSLIHKIGFVQNTAVIFRGNIFHKSTNNFGNNIENGRLTLNIFFNLHNA